MTREEPPDDDWGPLARYQSGVMTFAVHPCCRYLRPHHLAWMESFILKVRRAEAAAFLLSCGHDGRHQLLL
jgi:hypothetical protein